MAASTLSYTRIVHELEIDAPPQRVFEALTENVAKWWSHLTYETAGTPELRVEPRVGGRFFERAGAKERLYATVTRYEPPVRLGMQGPMGMPGCVFGTIEFDLVASDGQTRLTLTHAVMGALDDETVGEYRTGWRALLEDGLKPFVEAGTEAWSIA